MKRRPSTVPRRLSRADFDRFVRDRNHPIAIMVTPPYRVVPCECGDVNCHGWRFVEIRS